MFGDNLKRLRKNCDMSMEDLAKLYNMKYNGRLNKSTISRYENGLQEPMISVAKNLADFFNVPVDILTGGERNSIEETACRPYPVIGEVAAGYGSEAIEEETGDYEQIPLEWLRGHNPDNFFVLRVKGDSMYPDFQDGDCVLVHRQSSVDSGTVAVMLYDGEIATLKKVRYKKNESWVELIPRNPEYQTKRIENWDLNECRVLGEVRRLIRVVR